MKRNRIYMIMLFFCVIVLGGCKAKPRIETQEAEVLEETLRQENTQESQMEEEPETSGTSIYVQVSGAVAWPGVYELPEGSRVFEAIELAGGMTAEADAGQMNQAQTISDGEMIYVKSQGEQVEGTSEMPFSEQTQQEDGKVNLNTATEEQLMTLPGIGQAKAKSIIAWREENGNFSKIEDLMEIEGIKEGVFSKVKDSIKVD